MPKVALLGANDGPWVDISRIETPRLLVQGLPAGAFLYVVLEEPTGRLELYSNGIHVIPRAAWVQIRCIGATKHSTICKFVSQRVA